MIAIYPFGIPLLYFVLVYVSRNDVNPDPLEVLEDCITGMTGGESKFELNDEIRSLAFYSVELRRIAEEAKANGQLLAKELNEKLQAEKEKKMASRQGSMAKLGAFLDVDEVEEVGWEAAAPGFALAFHKIKLSLDVLDQELCFRYRAANPDVKGLAFLYEAYEPRCYYFESYECVRRLMLTGMLIFIADGTNFQIAAGTCCSLLWYTIYNQEAPFMDEEADAIGTVAQMSTFTQLFFALLIGTGVLLEADPPIPDVVITTLMLISNVMVMVTSMLKPLHDAVGDKLKEKIQEVYDALKMTYDYFFPPPEAVEDAVDALKRTPEEMLKFVIFRQRGRKITDIINITKGGPAIEEAAGAASMWMRKGAHRKANFGATPGRNVPSE